MKSYCWLIDTLLSLFIALIFYGIGLLNRYKFGYYLSFDIALTLLIISSSIFMGIFLYFRKGCTRCQNPLKIPWPSFVCMIALSSLVALGYAYTLLFKLAYRECPHVSDGDADGMLIKAIQRISVSIMTILAVFYLIRRTYFGALDHKMDLFCRFTINTTLILFRLDLIGAKVYKSIEDICGLDDFNSMLKIFCPQNLHHPSSENSSTAVCNATTEREFTWIILDKNLVHPAILSIATELIPVLLVIHWLVCGYGEQRAEILASKIKVGTALKVPSFILNMVAVEPEQNGGGASAPIGPGMPKWTRKIFAHLSLLLMLLGICHWLASFYIFLRTYGSAGILHNKFDYKIQELNNYAKFVVASIQIVLRFVIYLWVRNVPCGALDLNYMADASVDKFLMYSTLPFLLPAALAHISERVYFLLNFGQSNMSQEMVVISNVPIGLNIISKCLEALALSRLLALPKRMLQGNKCFLPTFIVASIAINFCDFFGTYFAMNQISRHIGQFIGAYRLDGANHWAETFTIVGLLAKLLSFSNFLFTFTCALAWVELILRYRHNNSRAYYDDDEAAKKKNGLPLDVMKMDGEEEDGDVGRMSRQKTELELNHFGRMPLKDR